MNVFLGFFALIFGWSLGIWMYNVLGVVIFTGYIQPPATLSILNAGKIAVVPYQTLLWLQRVQHSQ